MTFQIVHSSDAVGVDDITPEHFCSVPPAVGQTVFWPQHQAAPGAARVQYVCKHVYSLQWVDSMIDGCNIQLRVTAPR